MPGTTPRLALPYPVGPDVGGVGDTVIKSLAEAIDTKLDITTMPDGVGRRARNLCLYNESVSNGAGLILIQTNIPANSSVMTTLTITGMTYEPDNNTINVAVTFYPYSLDSSIVNPEVTNMGSFAFSKVEILSRNSDGLVAIALSSPTALWQYPKLAVDGIFGHTALMDTQLTTGWSISRVANLTGYTVKATPHCPRPSGEDTGWITMTLQNGWGVYGAPDWPAQYRRKGGVVYIRGLVTTSVATPTASIFQMPVGFRPYKNTLRGQIDAGGVVRQTYVTAGGDLYPSSAPHPSWFSIENITYPVEA